ncbi:hypothetical protein HK101_002625, partial [Irineochytrium annulatum]
MTDVDATPSTSPDPLLRPPPDPIKIVAADAFFLGAVGFDPTVPAPVAKHPEDPLVVSATDADLPIRSLGCSDIATAGELRRSCGVGDAEDEGTHEAVTVATDEET